MKEQDREYLESLHFRAKSALLNPYIKDHEIFGILKKLAEIPEFMKINGYKDEELDAIFDLNEIKDLVEKFMLRFSSLFCKENQ